MGRTRRRPPFLQLTQHRSILPALKWRGLASGCLMLTCLSLRHLCPSYQVLCHQKSKACVVIFVQCVGQVLDEMENLHQTAAASPRKEELVSDSEEDDDPDYVPEN